MSQKDQHIDLFDKYQANELSDTERLDFDERIKDDAEFSQAFEQYIAEINVIKAIGVGEEMREIMSLDEASSNSLKLKYLIPIGIAATLVLGFFLLPDKKLDNQALFETYFEPFPNLISARDNTTDLGEALNAYSQGNYQIAIQRFEKLSEKSDTVLFYQALSHLALKEVRYALIELNELDTQSSFYTYSVWYKGLAHLLIDQKDSVNYYLNGIKENSTYIKDAHEILKELN